MSLPTHLTNNASQLPFYCSANSLLFYLDDSTTYSQVLTLYNPYDFAVRFKVLCTAPRKYSIAEPQGEIRAQHSVDIIVRLLDTSSPTSNHNVVHTIRIQYFDRRKPQEPIGKRDITCTILSYKPSEESFDDDIRNFSNISSRVRSGGLNLSPSINTASASSSQTYDPLVVVILTLLGAISAIVLILPTIHETDSGNSVQSRLPSYLQVTSNAKVIASYILEHSVRIVQVFSQLSSFVDNETEYLEQGQN